MFGITTEASGLPFTIRVTVTGTQFSGSPLLLLPAALFSGASELANLVYLHLLYKLP
jgi:hypothetical protein